MRLAPARPMTTELSWLDTWLTLPVNCLVMFRNGTTMLMLNGQAGNAEVGRAGQQQNAAHQGHHHIQHIADVVQNGHQHVGVAVGASRSRRTARR